MVRNTDTDIYPAHVRAEYIRIWMMKHTVTGTIIIVPNIEGIYWGRGVGYRTEEINVDVSIQNISGTGIRNQMQKDSLIWKKSVADENSASLLTPTVARIVEYGAVVWLTGCPSSGKTTIANALRNELSKQFPFLKTQILDGDDMRTSPLAAHIGFTQKDRADHIRRMAYIANIFAKHRILVICAFVSPDKKIREEIKRRIGKDRFIEVYVSARKQTRIQRDPKGLYKKSTKRKTYQSYRI